MLNASEHTFNSFCVECCVVWLFSCCIFLATWLGVWLASSKRTLAARLAIVLLGPACLIAGKASEIYWGWISLSLMVAVGYWLIDGLCLQPKSDVNEPRSAHFRFSIRSLLFCMLVVSWFLFVYLQTMYRDWLAWRSVLAISVAFALFAVGVHVVVGATHRRHIVWLIAIRLTTALMLILVVPLAWMDELLPAFLDDFSVWPPQASMLLGMFGSPELTRMMWFVIGGVFWCPSILIPSPALWSILSRRWKIGTVLLLLFVGAFPMWVGTNMMLPIAREAARQDFNAYHELVAIGHECENSSFEKALATYSEWEAIPVDEQQTLLAETQSLLAKMRETLQKPIWFPVAYSMNDIDSGSAFRSASRLAIAHGKSQFETGPSVAADTTLMVAKMGANLQHGGLMIHSLIGIAISAQAIDLFKVRLTNFSPEDRSRIVMELKRMVAEMESAEVIRERDINWSNTLYWVSHVRSILDRAVGVDRDVWGFRAAVHRHLAEWRMLIIELLLENQREEMGAYPADLLNLLADRPELVQDPFASNQQFQYRKTPDGFLLYSVGENGVDDGGSFESRPDFQNGMDLSLASRLLVPKSVEPQ